MRTDLKIRKLFVVSVRLFAIIGAFATVYWAHWIITLPHVVAAPNSFVIMDVYRSSSDDGPSTRVYFDAPSSEEDLRFEGSELSYRFGGRSDLQSSIPLRGVAVAGKGKILFGSSVIIINDGSVSINGQATCPTQVTVTRGGKFREGFIRIAR